MKLVSSIVVAFFCSVLVVASALAQAPQDRV